MAPEDVRAIGFSHQRCTFALAGADHQPLTNLIVWMDQRGVPYLDSIHERVGLPSYYDVTGLPIYYISSLSKLLWLRANIPGARDVGVRIWPISNFMMARMGIDDPPGPVHDDPGVHRIRAWRYGVDLCRHG